jgi:UDP-2-acetamido-2-deoxy-ribo-hexuluronate aminotransferase
MSDEGTARVRRGYGTGLIFAEEMAETRTTAPSPTIQMVDLLGLHARFQEELDEALLHVAHSGGYIQGKEVKNFAEELAQFSGARHVIPCGNGTDALQIALMALGLEQGDEVITTGFTFIATVEVVALLGLKPVLVDVDPKTYNIDTAAVEAAITPKTKAIVPVHLFGQCADMEALMALANAHGIPVVEDTAQAIGATWKQEGPLLGKQAGTMGAFGTTSFFPSKNLGCMGDGGALFTNDAALAARAASVANHGMGMRYYHDRVGVNSRLDAMQAAVLRVKLRHLPACTERRQAAADRYDALLASIDGAKAPYRDQRTTHVFHQYTLTLESGIDRDQVVQEMREAGIPTGVYYPVPGHKQQAFAELGYNSDEFKVSDQLSACVLSLPMHTELTHAQQAYIVETLARCIRAQGKSTMIKTKTDRP